MDITFIKSKVGKAITLAAGALLFLGMTSTVFAALSPSDLPSWAQDSLDGGEDFSSFVNYDDPAQEVLRGTFSAYATTNTGLMDFFIPGSDEFGDLNLVDAEPRFDGIEQMTKDSLNLSKQVGLFLGDDGTNNVAADRPVNRAEVFGALLSRLNGWPTLEDLADQHNMTVAEIQAELEGLVPALATVPAGQWYTDNFYVSAAFGVLQGEGNGQANPEGTFNVAQLVTVVARSLNADLLPGLMVVEPPVEECVDDEETPEDECEETPSSTSDATLTVSINEERQIAANTFVPIGALRVPVLALDFTAEGAEGEVVTVESIYVARSGPGGADEFDELAWFDGDTLAPLTTERSLNTSTNDATNNGRNFDIPAGETLHAVLMVDIAPDATPSTQSVFVIPKRSDIVTNAASVSGPEPLSGNPFQIAGVSVGSVTVSVPSQITDIVLGEVSDISEFEVDVNGNDVLFRSIALENYGSVDLAAFQDVVVEIDGELFETIITIDGDVITITLVEDVLIEDGDQVDITIRALVSALGGIRPNRDTVQLALDDESHALFSDANVGFNSRVINNFTSDLVNEVTIEGSDLTFIDNNLDDLTVGDEAEVRLLDVTAVAVEPIIVNEALVTIFVKGPGLNTPTFNAGVAEVADGSPTLVGGNEYDFDMVNAGNALIEVGDFVEYEGIYGFVSASDGDWTDGGLRIIMDQSPVGITDGTLTEVDIRLFLTDVEIKALSEDGEMVGASLSDTFGDLTDCTYNAVSDGYDCLFDSTWDIEGSEDGLGHVQRFAVVVNTEQETGDGLELAAEITFDRANALEYTFNGDEVEPENVNGINIGGPFVSVLSDGLTVTLSSDIASDIAVDDSDDVPLGAAFVQANNDSVMFDEMNWRIGAASTSNGFTDVAIGDLDPDLYIFNATLLRDGVVVPGQENVSLDRVDLVAAPGFQVGDFYFVNFDFGNDKEIIEEDDNATYSVHVNLRNGLDPADPDIFLYATMIPSLDIDNPENSEGNNVGVSPAVSINPLTAGEPDTFLTIAPSGFVTVEGSSNSPEASQVVAGTDMVVFAEYDFESTNEHMEVRIARVINSGTLGQFNDGDQVPTDAIRDLFLRFTDEDGITQDYESDLDGNGVGTFNNLDFILPQGQTVKVEIMGTLADDDEGGSAGNILSGQQIQLGFVDDLASAFDIRGVGSSNQIDPTVSGSGNVERHEVVLGKLTFLENDEVSGGEVLLNNDVNILNSLDVIKEGDSVDAARFVYRVATLGLTDVGDDIDEFTFRFNGNQLDSDDVNIWATSDDTPTDTNVENGGGGLADVEVGGFVNDLDPNFYYIVVTFPSELTFTDSENTMSLRARVTGAPGGTDVTITTRLNDDDEDLANEVTTCVNDLHNANRCRIYDSTGTGPGLFAAAANFTQDLIAGRNIILSDRSEVPEGVGDSWFTLTGPAVDDASGPNSFRNGFLQELGELQSDSITYIQ